VGVSANGIHLKIRNHFTQLETRTGFFLHCQPEFNQEYLNILCKHVKTLLKPKSNATKCTSSLEKTGIGPFGASPFLDTMMCNPGGQMTAAPWPLCGWTRRIGTSMSGCYLILWLVSGTGKYPWRNMENGELQRPKSVPFQVFDPYFSRCAQNGDV
jgi:hypothetical protein